MPKYPLSEMEYGETILLQADLYHYMLSYQKCIAQVSCGIINTNSVFIPCSKTLLQYLHRVYAQKRLRVYAHMRHKVYAHTGHRVCTHMRHRDYAYMHHRVCAQMRHSLYAS